MNYYFKHLFYTLTLFFFMAFFPAQLLGQMFSIDDPQPQTQRMLGASTLLGVSWEFGDFSYQGEVAEPDQRVDFNDSILRLRLESPGLDIGLAFGGALTGMNDNSYLNITGRLYNNFPLKRDTTMYIAIPLQLTTDYKQVRLNASDAEFRQSSLVIGTGLSSAFRLNDRFSINVKATPNFGFSFSQGSLFGGNLFRFDGNSFLLINNVFGETGLFIGYHFDYRRYRIEGDLNDYDFTSHSISVGIGF